MTAARLWVRVPQRTVPITPRCGSGDKVNTERRYLECGGLYQTLIQPVLLVVICIRLSVVERRKWSIGDMCRSLAQWMKKLLTGNQRHTRNSLFLPGRAGPSPKRERGPWMKANGYLGRDDQSV